MAQIELDGQVYDYLTEKNVKIVRQITMNLLNQCMRRIDDLVNKQLTLSEQTLLAMSQGIKQGNMFEERSAFVINQVNAFNRSNTIQNEKITMLRKDIEQIEVAIKAIPEEPMEPDAEESS